MTGQPTENNTSPTSILRGRESEFATALLDIVGKIVTETTAARLEGRPAGLFPNGIGLFEVQACVEHARLTFSARIADLTVAPRDLAKQLTFSTLAPTGISVDILNYCVSLDDADDPVMTDCNAFVKKVGGHFGVAIPDLNDDGIIDGFGAAPFTRTTMDVAEAMSWAKEGLVVAGMKLSDLNPAYGTEYKNGHVAIVHAIEDTAHTGFPMASWGTLGSRGHANQSIRQSFPAQACDDDAVHFAYAAAQSESRLISLQPLGGVRGSSAEAAQFDFSHSALGLSIDDLDLVDYAKSAAQKLLSDFPDVVFTSGRRDVARQASAMAGNVVQNRSWVRETYLASSERDLLQGWVDANPDATTKDAAAAGLTNVMTLWSDDQKRRLSRHFSGQAFDVQPIAGSHGDEVKVAINALPNLRKFLDHEGGLIIWHADFELRGSLT